MSIDLGMPQAGAPGSAPKSPDRSVRPALAQDAPQIARIQAASLKRLFGASAQVDEQVLVQQWATTLTAPAPAGCFTLVALHANAVAGYALVVPADDFTAGDGSAITGPSLIAEMDVDESFRRSGHASRLVQACVDVSRATALSTWIDSRDEARIRFFTSCGFGPAGLRRTFPDMPDVVQHLWWTSTQTPDE